MEFSFHSMWEAMGPIAKGVVFTLLGMSVLSLAIGIERLVAFSRAASHSRAFAGAIRIPLASRAFDAVVAQRDRHPHSPLARVIARAVAEYAEALRKQADGATYDAVDAAQRASERSIEEEMAKLRRGLGVLATVGSTAPFVGLFGTVFGIITAFQSMGKGAGDLATIGPGIAEALVTTAIGIAVAIGAVWLYNAFTARVEAVGGALSVAKEEMVDFFIKDQGRAPAKKELEAA